jgi:hypothetical protein
VRAGDYYLFAIADGSLEYANPSVLKPYLAHARRIHLDAHADHSERVTLAK